MTVASSIRVPADRRTERRGFYRSLVAVIACCLGTLAACSADQPLNPSFSLTLDDAQAAMKQMKENQVKLRRPVVVVGGYRDPGIGSGNTKARVERMVNNPSVLNVPTGMTFTFDQAADRLVDAIEKEFPSDDPNWTTEVDVIGISMGGLVARYAAMPVDGPDSKCATAARADVGSSATVTATSSDRTDSSSAGASKNSAARTAPVAPDASDAPPAPAPPARKRLRVARLFTISSPHRGAKLAPVVFFDPLAIDMHGGSAFLAKLDAALPDAGYELVPYVRLSDEIVGENNAAPPGMKAWWVQNQPFQFSHLNCGRDERILADIARRLRGEQPYTTSPPAELP